MVATVKKATVWVEMVTYIECPDCEYVECLGESIILVEETWFCEKCKQDFVIDTSQLE